MKWLRSNGYAKVSDSSSADGNPPDTATAKPFGTPLVYPWLKQLSLAIITLVNIILFATSILSMLLARHWIAEQTVGSPDYRNVMLNPYLKRISAYSPAFDAVDFNVHPVTFNGALRDNSSLWRQPPSPEVDAAWDYISTEGLEAITISSADVSKSGKDPAISIRVPLSWGAGPDAFVAQIDVFHQIHCLNELRKAIHYDYYYSAPPDQLQLDHRNHCLHMLLQSLMCNADMGVITHNWVHNDHIPEPKTRVFPDFNMNKQCRDFDALLDWARERGVKDLEKRWKELKYTQGEAIVPGDGYA